MVGAQSNDGIKTIEIFADGKSAYKCDLAGSKKNVSCYAILDSKSFGYDRNVAVKAVITSGKNKTTVVPVRNVKFYDATINVTGLASIMNIVNPVPAVYSVTANAPKGLKTIEIYLNGKVAQTCQFNGDKIIGTCALSIGYLDYPAGSALALNSRAVDIAGLDGWSNISIINVIADISAVSNAQTTDSNTVAAVDNRVYAWLWSEPNGNDMQAHTSKLIRTQALALDGLKAMDVYVNGTLKQTCAFSGQTAVQECDATVFGNDYPANTPVNITISAKDSKDKTVVSKPLTLTARQDNLQRYTLTGALTLQPISLDMTRQEKRTISVAGDASNGVKLIEILVNGKVRESCEFYGRLNSANCQTTLYGDKPYAEMGFMAVNARITDNAGNITWSDTRLLKLTDVAYLPAQQLNVMTSLDPDGLELRTDQSKQITADVYADKGIKEVNIYVNDTLWQTCSFTDGATQRTCGMVLSGSMYGDGAWATIRANTLDTKNNIAWSDSKTVVIHQPGKDPMQDLTVSIKTQADQFATGKSAVAIATTDAPQGVERVEMTANGKPVQSCYYGRSTGENQCSAMLDIKNLADGTLVTTNATATDVYGNKKTVSKIYQVQTPKTTDLIKNYLVAYTVCGN